MLLFALTLAETCALHADNLSVWPDLERFVFSSGDLAAGDMAVNLASFTGLAGCWCRQVFVVDGIFAGCAAGESCRFLLVDVTDLTKSSTLGAAVGRSESLAVASEASAVSRGGLCGSCRDDGSGDLLSHGVLEPPLAESALVEMKPMLLGANNHTGTHEAHVCNDLVGGKAMLVDEVGADQAASSSETGLAVNSNSLALDGDHLVGKIDEFADQAERRACAVVEDHVEVLDAQSLEVRRGVELRVETNNKTNAALNEVREDILEWLRNRG